MSGRGRSSGQWVLRCSLAFGAVFVIDVGSSGALNGVCRLYGPCPPAGGTLPAPSAPEPAPLRIELVDPELDPAPAPGAGPGGPAHESPPSLDQPPEGATSFAAAPGSHPAPNPDRAFTTPMSVHEI